MMLFDLLDSLGVKTARWKDNGVLLWGMTNRRDDFIRISKGDTLTLDSQAGDFGFYTARLDVGGNGRYVIMETYSEGWSIVITQDILDTIKNYIDMKNL